MNAMVIIPSLKSEWIKFSTIRSSRAILLMTLLIDGTVSFAVAKFVTDEVLYVSGVFIYSTVLTAVFAAVAGILVFSGEAQHGTLATLLTAQPSRWVVAVSKAVMAAANGLMLGAIGVLAGFLGAVLGGIDMGDTSEMAITTLSALAFTSIAAVLGLGVGMIVRHSSAAISGLLVWWLVAENLLNLFMPAKVTRFFPFLAGNNMLGVDDSDIVSAEALRVALTRTQNTLVFAGFAIVASVIGTVLLYRRDTN
jgi:ABC-2 type transport system permease protein